MKFRLKWSPRVWSIRSKNKVSLLSIAELAAICSKGHLPRKYWIFSVPAKTAIFAVSRCTPSQQQNRAAWAKLFMPLDGREVRYLQRRKLIINCVLKSLVVKLVVACHCNSSSINWIRDTLKAQISGPRLLNLHHHCEGYRGRPHTPLAETWVRWWLSPQSATDN